MQTANDGTRSLMDSILVPEIKLALQDWAKNTHTSEPLLIGGLAYSFYCKPRTTQDADLLFLSANDIPVIVEGFRRSRQHAFVHNKTHVEIEVLDPHFLHASETLIHKVHATAIHSSGYRIPSRQGLIALKIMRLSLQDRADIAELLKQTTFDVQDWPEIPVDKRNRFQDFRKQEGI